MIDQIENLGRQVKLLWEKENYSQEVFPQIASSLLKQARLHGSFNIEGFLHSLWEKKALPQQLYATNGFGHPPITVYFDLERNFVIDVYFWVTPEISIHSHGFRGAFTVLEGKSLQCQYDFHIKETLDARTLIGDVRFKEVVFLKKGDVQQILLGETFIHQVWHIGFPTVSLAIRTVEEQARQYTYLKPHLAFEKRDPTPLERKQLDALMMLHHTRHPAEESLFEKLLLETDFSLELFYFLEHIEKRGGLKRAKEILERVPKLCRWAPMILASLQEADESHVDWNRVQHEGEKFLLALLRVCSDKDQIFRLIQAYHPERPAEVSLLEWLEGLMKGKKVNFQLNKTALEILRFTLLEKGEEEICRTLSNRYQVENSAAFRGDIHAFCDQLRSIELLKPLLRTSLLKKVLVD